MSIKQRIRKWCTIDHVVDLSVDILLMIWDVITSPILIIARVLRHFVGEWFTDKIKAGVRWIAHWFERKREYRLEHGQGIFRTYWFLIILSPILVIGIGTGLTFLWMGAELLNWMVDADTGLFSDNPVID